MNKTKVKFDEEVRKNSAQLAAIMELDSLNEKIQNDFKEPLEGNKIDAPSYMENPHDIEVPISVQFFSVSGELQENGSEGANEI